MRENETIELLKDRIVSAAADQPAPASWVIRRRLARNEQTAFLSKLFSQIGPRFCRELFGDLSEWQDVLNSASKDPNSFSEDEFSQFLSALCNDIDSERELALAQDALSEDMFTVLRKFFRGGLQNTLNQLDPFHLSLILATGTKIEIDRILSELEPPLRRRTLIVMSRVYRLPYSAAVASALHLSGSLPLPAVEILPEKAPEGNIWNVLSTVNVSTPEHLMQQLPSIGELRELISSARSIADFFLAEPKELNQ